MQPLSRKEKRSLLLAAAAATVIALLYFLLDPGESWAPKCIFHSLTGLQCPGCGSQRMLHALLHGDLGEAWRQNPFLLCAIPGVLLLLLLELLPARFPRLYMRVHSVPAIICIAIAIILWGILRNI